MGMALMDCTEYYKYTKKHQDKWALPIKHDLQLKEQLTYLSFRSHP